MEEEKKQQPEEPAITAGDIADPGQGGGDPAPAKAEPTEEELRRRGEQARLRREKERKEREDRIREEAYRKGLEEGARKAIRTNPYTGKEIADSYDLEVYQAQKEIEARGGNPVEDLPEAMAERSRAAARKAEEEARARDAKDAEIREEIAKAMRENPEYGDPQKLKALMADPGFAEFSEGKWDAVPLSKIVSSYAKFIGKYGPKAGGRHGMPTPPGPNGSPNPKRRFEDMSDSEQISLLRKKGWI